ncbi:N-acetylglucosamine-6-phosphate deacetylase [Rubellimicrobium aerolatum]|uniref:N-acetylglucosamine-6-phosphate deacetylase n=1 Tax=Rubellimicrobium aerolatum TaxID=490979 RepID=A0ABW0SEP3_9RHOB|nr:amidohydrolase family protein [Rubellimicrobium aerolatum]MBP1806940.1 N-acetylglucosamine-6-phosphate deacetylase [Rubellimicrobium aerolatum]
MTQDGQIRGSILTPDGWVSGRLVFDEHILAVQGVRVDDARAPFVIPGFIDLHVHGGGGHDVMSGTPGIRGMARLHARHGTTSLLATSVTAAVREIEAFLAAVASVMAEPGPGEARVTGAHLEGPFINPCKLGAQPSLARPVDLAGMADWLSTGVVRIVTLAPELDGAADLVSLVQAQGARAQLGHSLCTYAEATSALAQGCGITHLFNAMSGVSHRGSGLAGAALAHADWAEVIPDLIHVEAGAILAARRAIPNLYGVTDATAGAGMPDGQYALGTQHVMKRGSVMCLADGTLAGSALTMDQALRNLVGLGLDLAEASARLSRLPAEWAGLGDAGRLAPGLRADLVELDADLRVRSVHIAGRPVDLSTGTE